MDTQGEGRKAEKKGSRQTKQRNPDGRLYYISIWLYFEEKALHLTKSSREEGVCGGRGAKRPGPYLVHTDL